METLWCKKCVFGRWHIKALHGSILLIKNSVLPPLLWYFLYLPQYPVTNEIMSNGPEKGHNSLHVMSYDKVISHNQWYKINMKREITLFTLCQAVNLNKSFTTINLIYATFIYWNKSNKNNLTKKKSSK